jgi:hypothetical protein
VLHTVPPKYSLGQTLADLDAHWKRLVRCIERGYLPIDNNAAENGIRPFVVGRNYPRSTIRQGLLVTADEA